MSVVSRAFTHVGSVFVLGTIVASVPAGCSSNEHPSERTAAPAASAARGSVAPSARAKETIDLIRRTFVVPGVDETPTTTAEPSRPALRLGTGIGFDRRGGTLVPTLPAVAAGGAHVKLPSRADHPFELRDDASGAMIRVSLEGAADAEAEVDGDGMVVFHDALAGTRRRAAHGTLVLRPHAHGVEDYVVLDEREPDGLVYDVELGEGVAGVRLVSNVLEALDANGAPRLHASPPYLTDANGTRHDAKVTLRGCAFDTTPASPWGKPVVDPGTSHCEMHVTWDDAGVAYPVLVDPQWATAAMMSTTRAQHTATAFTDYSPAFPTKGVERVLVVGGRIGGATTTATAEIYDPTSNTWASTGSMALGRVAHCTALYADPNLVVPKTRIVVSGGTQSAGGGSLTATEYWSPGDGTASDPGGTWTSAGNMASPRQLHTCTAIPSSLHSVPGVLVAGGTTNGSSISVLASMELYMIGAGNNAAWTSTAGTVAIPNMTQPRWTHGATLWHTDGNQPIVMIAGGRTDASTPTGTTDRVIWMNSPDKSISVTAGASMATARHSFVFETVSNFNAVAVGGIGPGGALSSAELFSSTSTAPGVWSTFPGTLSAARYGMASQLMANGRLLLIGGVTTADVSNVDVLSFTAPQGIYPASPVLTVRGYAASPAFPLYGPVTPSPFSFGLVTGGFTSGQTATNEVETWTSLHQANKDKCSAAGDCDTLYCANGYCCNSACSGVCDVCDGTGTTATPSTCYPAKDGTTPTAPGCSGNLLCNGTSASCPTQCGSDTECTSGLWCEKSTPNVCTIPKLLGATCSPVNDCATPSKCAECGSTNTCAVADGVCCTTACTGTCASCTQVGKVGTCSALPAGTLCENDAMTGAHIVCDGTSQNCATSCSSNANCATGYYCDAATHKCLQQNAGTPCTTASDCQTPPYTYCVGGSCCNAPCNDGCDQCVSGVCSALAAGSKPNGNCPAGYLCEGQLTCSTSCQNDNDCATGYYCASDATCKPQKAQATACSVATDCATPATGCRVCATGNCVDGVCCNTACGASCDACNVGGSVGTCTTSPKGSAANPACGGFLCSGTTTACPTSCGSNTDCATGYYCDPSKVCSPLQGAGNPCTQPSDCSTGLYCVDSVCCTTDCTGLCQACSAAKKGSGSNGICGPIAAGQDPDGECAAQASTTCGTTGTCDGSGQCAVFPAGTPCGSITSCTNNQETDYACNGVLNGCVPLTSKGCAPYVCSGTTCGTTCASDLDCTGATYCDTTKKACVPTLTAGSTCTAGDQCATGNCVDGYCCNDACGGGCDRCDLTPGTCTIVASGTQPVGCSGSTGYVCNGTSAACPTTCVNDNNCATGYYCASDGTCKPQKAQASTCAAADCLTANCRVCSSGGGCVDGYCCDTQCSGTCDVCNGATPGTCSPAGAGALPTAPGCGGYKCASGTTACPATCNTNGDCVAGYFCDTSSNTCQQVQGVGVPCTQTSECNTAANLVCVDGVCCDNDCTGTCMACTAAKKGSGVDGFCGPIAAATDPDSECADTGATGCGTNGSCNGSGSCALYPAGTICGNGTSCSGSDQTNYQCNGNGSCNPVSTTKCAPYTCNGTACGSTCTADTDCVPGSFCDTSTGTCVGAHGSGAPCTANDQCSTGFCVDGVCCDKACTGTCFACSKAKKGSGDDGTCAPILAGSDPDAECTTDPVSTCQHDGFCDGQGSCELYKQGTACGSATCVGNTAVGALCNSFNECKPDTTGVACDPYVCGASGCPSSCADSSQCVGGFYCAGAQCVPKKAKGQTCAADAECTTAHCVDGLCCNEACNGQCQACDVTGSEGTCTTVMGKPHGMRPACKGTAGDTCAGTCDGKNSDVCTYPDQTTLCAGTTCDGNVFKPMVCDSQGACVAGTTMPCGTYACDAKAGKCLTKCASDADCASTAKCNLATGQCATATSSCKDPVTSVSASGMETSCLPYKCVMGACSKTCTTSGDCAMGYACSATGKCEATGGTGGAGGAAGSGGAATSGHGGAAPSGGTGGATAGASSGGKSGASTGGAGGSAGAAPSGAAPAENADQGSSGGCGCAVPRSSGEGPAASLLVLALAIAARRRRAA